MSIFKHEASDKCLTFGDFGSSFNNNLVTLQNCPDGIERSDFGDAKSKLYKISSNGQCVIPNSENNSLILGSCKNNEQNTKFSIYHTTNNTEKSDEIKAYIVFSGGRDNINLNNSINTWQKKLTNSSHKNTYENINSYFILYNFDNNETYENLYRNNGLTKCSIKLIIDENNNNGETISTTYYLTPNVNKTGLVFSETEYTTEKLVIKSEARIKNNNNFNTKNFGLIRIGFNGKYASLNHKINENMMTLLDNVSQSSLFRILFIDNADNFKVLYDSKNNTKLYSYVNPVKKIAYHRNQLMSRNLNNKSNNFNFNIIEGMTSGQSETPETTYLEIPNDVNGIILSINKLIGGEITNFDSILTGINNVKNIMINSSSGNANAHTQAQQNFIELLENIIKETKNSYNSILIIHGGYNNNISDLNQGNLASIKIQSNHVIINSYNNIKDLLPRINAEIIHYNDNINFKLNDFILNPNYLNLLASVFEYLNRNQNTIKSKTNEIYQYLPEVEYNFMNGLPKINSYNNMISSQNILIKSFQAIHGYINQLENSNDKKSLIKINFSRIHNDLLTHLRNIKNKIDNQMKIINKVKAFGLYQISNLEQFNSTTFPSVSEPINIQSFSNLITSLYNNYSKSARIPSSFSDNIKNTFNSLNDGNYIPQKFKFLYESFGSNNVPTPKNLNEYYSQQFLINYKQKEMIDEFKLFYSKLYNIAKTMTLNKSSTYSTPINETFSNIHEGIEGFSSRDVINNKGRSDKILPSGPKYLNQCQYAGTPDARNLIEAGFLYNGKSLAEFINTTYSDYDIGRNPYDCSSVTRRIEPEIGISYDRTSNPDQSLTSTIGFNYLADACETGDVDAGGTCDFFSAFHLDVSVGNYVHLRIEQLDNSGVNAGNRKGLTTIIDLTSFGISIPGGSVDDYEKIFNEADISGKHDFFTRVFSKADGVTNSRSASVYTNFLQQKNTFQLLEKTNNPEERNLMHHSALYSDDTNEELDKFRLIIDGTKDGGTLTLQYIKKQNADVFTGSFSSGGSSYNYGKGKDIDSKQPIVSLYGLKDNNKNKVGNTVNKLGYLSVNNKYKQYNQSNAIKSNTNLGYKTYAGYDISSGYLGGISTEVSCNANQDCIGLHDNGSVVKGIMSANRQYIYNTGAGGTNSIKLKKFGLQLTDNLYMNDSSNNGYLTDSSGFVLLEGQRGSLELPTIENILEPNYNDLKSGRTRINTKYANLVNSFNTLTENELVMLKEAGISVKELKTLINRYDDFKTNLENKVRLKNLFDTQKHDSSQLYNKSEYTMALTGIASIASLMYVFNYMKK